MTRLTHLGKWLFSPSSPSGQSITALRNVFRSGSFALDRNLNAVEKGWPFRLGLQGCIVDRSQDIDWQRTFGHGRKVVPEMLQRGGADDDAIIAFGVEFGMMNQPPQRHGDRIETMAFAGIWTEFRGDWGTKSKPIPGPHNVYGFLTTSPNAIVEPIHPKATPVILTTDEERDIWLRAPLIA